MSKNKSGILTYSALFAVLITIGAYLKIPLPIVPFTMQMVFVIMTGQIGGKKIGFNSVLIYIILGLVGLPVFSQGAEGISYILRPTFGYIIGFLIGAYLIGFILEIYGLNMKIRLFASFIALIIIYFCGYFYYLFLSLIYFKTPFNAVEVFKSFVLIFIPKDILSCVLASMLSEKITKITHIKIKDYGDKI